MAFLCGFGRRRHVEGNPVLVEYFFRMKFLYYIILQYFFYNEIWKFFYNEIWKFVYNALCCTTMFLDLTIFTMNRILLYNNFLIVKIEIFKILFFNSKNQKNFKNKNDYKIMYTSFSNHGLH